MNPLRKTLSSFLLFLAIGCGSSRQPQATTIILDSKPGESKGTLGASQQKTDLGTKDEKTKPVEVSRDQQKLQKKYAALLGVAPEQITNIRLYQFIDEWLNTPYLWGGDSKAGIDCSAFMQKLYDKVYDIYIPRTSPEQFFSKWIDRFASTKNLSEGDLVFFKTLKGKPITHVGFYVGNRMFVNSSSSKGVSFGNLDDQYWQTKYVAAGRIKQQLIKRLR